MWLLFGAGGFHNIFDDRPTKQPISKNNHQNMHPQLINMDLQKDVIIKG
jgi:hypothetical protein